MNELIEKLKKWSNLYLVVLPFWGIVAWGYAYEKSLVKQYQRNDDKIDYTISIMELKVLSYELYGVDKLTDMEKGRYERAKARLINLENQRDEEVGSIDN